MKFIFPQNYNLTPKILGIIEYQTAILNIIWAIIVIFLSNLIFNNLNYIIFISIILIFPILIISIVGINGENLVYVIIYIFKYMVKPKLLFYEKRN